MSSSRQTNPLSVAAPAPSATQPEAQVTGTSFQNSGSPARSILPALAAPSSTQNNSLYKALPQVNVNLHEYHNHSNYNTYYHHHYQATTTGDTTLPANVQVQQPAANNTFASADFYPNLFAPSTQQPSYPLPEAPAHAAEPFSGSASASSYYSPASSFADYYQPPHSAYGGQLDQPAAPGTFNHYVASTYTDLQHQQQPTQADLYHHQHYQEMLAESGRLAAAAEADTASAYFRPEVGCEVAASDDSERFASCCLPAAIEQSRAQQSGPQARASNGVGRSHESATQVQVQQQPHLSMISRRKNATRETTATLKDWLDEHGQNPYPTKGEKIMLSIITKMSLNQVSTWFANARRRMKKENKVFWGNKQGGPARDPSANDSVAANGNSNNTNSSNSQQPDAGSSAKLALGGVAGPPLGVGGTASLRYFIHKHQKQLAGANAIMTLGHRFDGGPFVYCRRPQRAGGVAGESGAGGPAAAQASH